MRSCRIFIGAGCIALLAASVPAYAANLGATDRTFLTTAARIDMTEANEGQLAENQATRADIRDLGKMMVQDYSASYSQLGGLAAKMDATIPKGIDTTKDRTIEQLVALKGERFDRQFAQDEVRADRNAIAVFRREANHGTNSDMKAYAAKMIPVLENELKRSEAVARPVKRT